jgi:hypothetical protein
VTGNLLLTGYRLTSAALGASVRLGSLTTNWQSPAVSQSTNRLDVTESSDVQLSLTSKVTFDEQTRSLNRASDSSHLFFTKIPNTGGLLRTYVRNDFLRGCATNSVNGCESDFESLVVWNIYTGNDCHRFESPVDRLALSRLESRVLLVDYVNATLTANNLASWVLCLY